MAFSLSSFISPIKYQPYGRPASRDSIFGANISTRLPPCSIHSRPPLLAPPSCAFLLVSTGPHYDEITIDQAIQCLKAELGRNWWLSSLVLLSITEDRGPRVEIGWLGPSAAASNDDEMGFNTNTHLTESMQQSLHAIATSNTLTTPIHVLMSMSPKMIYHLLLPAVCRWKNRFRRTKKGTTGKGDDNTTQNTSDDTSGKTVLVPSNTSSTSGIAFFVMVCDSIQKLGSISLHIWPFTRSRTGKKVDRSEVSNYVKHKGSGIRFQWPLMAIIKLARQVFFFSPFASLRILCTYRTSLSEPNHRSIGRGKDASVCWIGD